MKQILLSSIFIFLANFFYSQEIDTTDIFNTNKEGYLILKPAIEKKIVQKIAPKIKQKLEILRNNPSKDFEYYEPNRISDEYEFAKDTIRINEFLAEYETSYSMATSTMGMNWKSSKYLDEYDKLLNKYYQKAQNVLLPNAKNKLIDSQRKWLSYYNNEKDFVYSLNDFGNHNSSLYCWGYYMKMMEERVEFLRDIYNKNFQGSNVFKEQ